jgi:hypothetical protein
LPELPGYSAPGSVLGYGEAATVMYSGPRAGYKLRIRVLHPVEVRSAGANDRTYYVRYDITNLGPSALAAAQAEAVVPIGKFTDNGGSFSGSFFGSLSSCVSVPPPHRLAPGITWRSCDTYTVPGRVLGFTYGASGTPYLFSPIRWS